jgi:hypothetical protein
VSSVRKRLPLWKMPIPTRSNRDPQPTTEVKSKIPSARALQRTISTVVPDAAKKVVITHERAVSSIPEIKVGSTEQSFSSLQRKPSIRPNPPLNARQPTATYRQTAKPSAVSNSIVSAAPKTGGVQKPQLKPQFSTYQQHFSPKRPPRPESIVSDTPSSKDSVTTPHETPTISRQRDEILQLRLLHVGSRKTLRDFETSSRSKLKLKFEGLRRQDDLLLELEQHRDRCINHTALQTWLQQNVEVDGDRLQLLASCIRDLDGLTAEGGRHFKVMLHFETWFEDMIRALESRKEPSGFASEALLFVEPIEAIWSQEVAFLQRKLQSIIQTFRGLGNADGGGIHFMLASYMRLADNLLQELEACISIQNTALEQEYAWVGQSLQDLLIEKDPAQAESAPSCRRGLWDDRVSS